MFNFFKAFIISKYNFMPKKEFIIIVIIQIAFNSIVGGLFYSYSTSEARYGKKIILI